MAEEEKTKEGGGGDGGRGDQRKGDISVGNTYKKIFMPRGATLADVIELLKKEGLLPQGITRFTIRLNDTFIRHNGELLEINPVITEDFTLSFLLDWKGGF